MVHLVDPPMRDQLIKPALIARAVIVLVLALTLFGRQKDSYVTSKIVDEPAFSVIGISVRTSNAKEMSSDAIIGKQWARFMKENLLAQIPNKSDSAILAVYSDYASDKDGEYNFLIGARVNNAALAPAGMVVQHIAAGQYAIFTSERGSVTKVVPELWQRIWAIPKSFPGGDRAYKTDYEVYDQRAGNPQDTQIDLHIGINTDSTHK